MQQTNLVRLGMCQLLVEGGEPERNLQRAARIVQQAASAGCQIALLPEALDLGWTHPSAKTEAKPIPGSRSDLFCDMAREHGMYICCGLTEQDGVDVYNTAILVDDRGEIILRYRKINELTVGHEFYSIGRSLGVVKTPFGLVGVNICSDNYYDAMEIGHVLARMGAQLILSPSAWTVDYSYTEQPNPYGEKWFKPIHTLAALYDIVIVMSTCVGVIVGGPYEGKKMVGCSLAVNRNGICKQGSYNEFASELVVVDLTIPPLHEKGTAIGDMLRRKGYYS
jgi:predicted amidohydrolase